jgi:hypothetical protein
MATSLPQEGELQLGPVRLPAGRRVTPDEHDGPVAWVTERTVPDPGLVWSALADLHGETGLVPVVLNDEADEYDDLFMEPRDVAEMDRLDVAGLLAAGWESELDDDEDERPPFPGTPRATEFLGLRRPRQGGNSLFDIVQAVVGVVHDREADAELRRLSELDRQTPEYQQWAARSGEREGRRPPIPFPGLAPATDTSLSAAARTAALRSLRPARIGLIAARRPADVLAATGWTATDDYRHGLANGVWIGAVLRSWECRFGAHLLAVGPGAEIRVLVQRPPPTLQAAGQIAAEHSAFCTECAGRGLRTIPEIAPALVDAPIWTFWWD